MKMKSFLSALLLLVVIKAGATETTVWQGSKKFTSWSDVLNIDGSKLNKVNADDVLHLSIQASAGAQLQLSWGSSWTCFDGLEHKDINGDFEMVITAQDVNRIKQGIHIKGVNFTLTAVKLKSNDGEYTTMAEDLFDWKNMLPSGASQGQSCIVGLKAYGGVGWYWPEKVDLSGFKSDNVRDLKWQLLYDEKGVKRQNIIKGGTQCKLPLNTTHKNVSSLNIISEKAQTVAIGSVNLTDKQGNVVPTCIDEQSILASRILSVEYYNTAGVRLNLPQAGINIVKINLEGGRVIVRKELK